MKYECRYCQLVALIMVVLPCLLLLGGCVSLSDDQWAHALAPAIYDAVGFGDFPESTGVIFVEDCPIEGSVSAILVLGKEKRRQYLEFVAWRTDYAWIKEWSLQVRSAAKTDVLSFVRDSMELLRTSEVSVAVVAFSPKSILRDELEALVQDFPQFAHKVAYDPEDLRGLALDPE